MRGTRRRKKEKSEDEVEQLLQAAQDQVLLNLSLNSHIARASPSSAKTHNDDGDNIHLDLDLERRFQALKTKSPAPQHKSVLEDDLSARFAALKGSSSSSKVQYEEESEDEEDQVQKLIQWAKDAARLDPSPPSDDEDPTKHK